MKAGRELDALVAEKIMGWQPFPYLLQPEMIFSYCPPGERVHMSTVRNVPSYSTDIAAAWQVVEKMKETHGIVVAIYQDGSARVEMSASRLSFDDDNIFVTADTAPLAICLAALKAKGVMA